MMTAGPRSVPAGAVGSERDGGVGERSGSERDGGFEEPRNSSSEDDVEVFGDGRDRLRRRGRPRVPRRASWNASFGTQTALFGVGRRGEGDSCRAGPASQPCSRVPAVMGEWGRWGGALGSRPLLASPAPLKCSPAPQSCRPTPQKCSL
jgi:hypothetical protein